MENMKQESTQIDEQMTTITDQCKEYQNQMEVCFFIFIIMNLSFSFLATSSSIRSIRKGSEGSKTTKVLKLLIFQSLT